MKTVKLTGNVVQEIIPDYALPAEKWYGAAFAAECIEAPDEVEQGWVYDAETGTFSPPCEPPAPEPTPEEINAQAIAELSMSYAQEIEQAQAAIMELSMLIGGIVS